MGWSLLLLLTHAAAFLVARPKASSSAGFVVGAMDQPAPLPAAKAGDRQRPKPPSVHAGLLAELNASDLKGEEYDKAFAAIFREWIKRDLRGALLFAFGPESGQRSKQVGRECEEALKGELLAQAMQVGQWISSGYFGSRSGEVAGAWAKALVEAGPQREIVMEALPHLPKPARVEAIDELCDTAKDHELAELRRWMVPESQGGLEDYAKRVVRFSGDDAENIFAGEDDPKVLEELCKAYKQRHVDSLPATEAVAAALKFPESYCGELLKEIAGRESGGMAGFTAMLSEMDRLGLWEGLPGECEQEILSSGIEAHYGSYSLPEEVLAQLGGISRESTRLAAFKEAGGRVAGRAGEALVNAMEALPQGKERDALIEGIWDGAMKFSDETAARVLASVSDPGLRARLQASEAGEAEANEGVFPLSPSD
ncbi:hypothetical protein [Haloferula sp. BvORR071]|uniref:hypothetical protein n=1 Tax=Haloferula sp. BvORR071 TaxID=1396141 RepID=UPI0022410042|nr:hypothetical protein [Haloferula sp. BvORR071]